MAPARHRRLLLLFGLLAVLVYAADQVTKVLAVRHLVPNEVVPLVGGLLQLRLVRNPGAAFSIGTSVTWVFTLVMVVVVVAILRTARRLGSRGWAVALGLLLAGALGNLTDRLLRSPGFGRGHVVDFLELPSWPIFNIADSSICVAAVCVVVLAMRDIDVNGQRTGRRTKDSPRDADTPARADEGAPRGG